MQWDYEAKVGWGIFAVFVFLILSVLFMGSLEGERRAKLRRLDEIQGYEAGKSGISAEANPRENGNGDLWLKGWMRAQAERKAE